MITGFALVDKPAGWTSHDVVARLRRLYGQRRVGHAGTLDPMATGVLIVGLGAATRLLRFVQDQPKTYEATIRLGVGTTTDDAEGEVICEPGWAPDADSLQAAIGTLRGDIEQAPSAVSAVKVDGVRAYARVRRGEDVELKPRPVRVTRFETVGDMRQDGSGVDVDVVVDCSSGTYVRALARDLGTALSSAGHLTALRRTAIGEIQVTECTPLGEDAPPVTPPEQVMRQLLPHLVVQEQDQTGLRHGRPVPAQAVPDGVHAAVNAQGELLAVVDVAQGSGSVLVNLMGQ